MIAEVTTLAPFGAPMPAPAEGLVALVGPVVTLAFTLPLGGPLPANFEPPLPQSCQGAADNVALQVLVVDQDGNAVDLSAASGLQFWLLAPDGTPRPVVASFVSNGMDGLLQYVASAQDLVEAGAWRIQAQIAFGARTLLTGWGLFTVFGNVADEGGA